MTEGGRFEEEPPRELVPQDYAIFLIELRALLNRIADQPDILSPVRREELLASISEMRSDRLGDGDGLDSVISDMQYGGSLLDQRSMIQARLNGANGQMKLGGWRRARDRFYDWMSRKNARRALRWANPILDSMSTIVPFLKPVQEVIQVTGNLIADAAHEAGED